MIGCHPKISGHFRKALPVVDANEIPSYDIYGVTVREVDPRFIHVERVSDRTKVHAGSVKPHRHAFLHQLALWQGEGCSFRMEDKYLSLPDNCVTLVPAGSVHGFETTPGCDAVVISLSNAFFHECLAGAQAGLATSFLSPSTVMLEGENMRVTHQLFARVEEEYHCDREFRRDAIAVYVRLILISHARSMVHVRQAESGSPQRTALLSRFLELADIHFRERWPVTRYVQELGTTSYLLNQATAASLKQSPGEILRSRTIVEAKRLLLYSMLAVAEVAEVLGYEDSAHFGRLFRDMTGRSPSRWRRSVLAESSLNPGSSTGNSD